MSAWLVAPAWLLLGMVLYHSYGRRHVLDTRAEIVKLREVSVATKVGFRILVPVANPDSALQMVPLTLKLGRANDAEVVLAHMVPVPDQVPLSDAARYSYAGEEAIAEAMLYMATSFPLSQTLRYCRNPARGILSAAKDYDANLIIMGWRGHSARHDFLFGSTVDPILERSPCDVVLLKNCSEPAYERILVPFAGGPHALLTLKVAGALLAEGGHATLLNVAAPGKPTMDLEAYLERNRSAIECDPAVLKLEHVVARDRKAAVMAAAAEADLVVIGASGVRGIRSFATQTLPEALGAQLETPMIVVRAATPVRSLMNRWF
jgi:nucleotide-binding universal stress UspA family protein